MRRLLSQAQRTILDHDAHNLIQRIRSRHGGQFGIGVICGLKESVDQQSVKNGYLQR